RGAATLEIYTLALHDALPISSRALATSSETMKATAKEASRAVAQIAETIQQVAAGTGEQNKEVYETARAVEELQQAINRIAAGRSEEHTSELQSRENLVCRLL